MTWPFWLLTAASVALAVQSAYAAILMLYAWEDEGKHDLNRAPSTFEPPSLSFTLLLPARHEEAVIRDTLQRLADLNYPRHLVQILAIVEAGDEGTSEAIREKLAELASRGQTNARLVSFDDPPINKPHGLNAGLRFAQGDVVTIFDAEDEPHPDILNVVNTVMLRRGTPVVQCGVQLMNYADHWFAALNVLEYFFWFKSRMHYQAARGTVALGGNTVFVERRLVLDMGGWDQTCLTEDAELGIRLSAAGVPMAVIYDDAYVTREETPPTVGQFVRQRTRWNQGFLQVLARGHWLRLPTWRQRLLACYTLGAPSVQALMMVYLPFSLWMMLFVKAPEPVALASMLPFYMLLVQTTVAVIGLFEFTSVHGLRPAPVRAVVLVLAYLPYQWLLCFAALRAAFRQLAGITNWEKTAHVGAHRAAEAALPRVQEAHG